MGPESSEQTVLIHSRFFLSQRYWVRLGICGGSLGQVAQHLQGRAFDMQGYKEQYLMEQNGKGVQEVVIAALKDVHYTDEAAAHVPPHLHLQPGMQAEIAPPCLTQL